MLEQERLVEDRENLTMKIRNLELEMGTIKNEQSEFEELVRANSLEISHLLQEKMEGCNKISELEKKSAERESEVSVLQDKLNKAEEEGSAQIMALSEKIKNLQHDLVSGQNETQELADQCEKLKLEVDSIHRQKSEVEEQIRVKDNENSRLREENLGFQETITALEKTLAEKRQSYPLYRKSLMKMRTKEELELHCGKIKEEHAESLTMVEKEKNELASKTMDLQRTLEEREDAYQKLNEEYKQIDSWFKECKALGRKINVADLEHTVEDLKRDLEEKGDEISTLLENVRMLEVKLRLSNQKLRVTEQLLSEKEESFRKTEEKFQQDQRALEERIATLLATINANNEALMKLSLMSKSMVEKLEAKVSKEELEKMNLTTTVVQLKKTVGELEKMMKEKEVGMLDFGGGKREAIRQLCLWIDYHRSRYDYLKDIISKTRSGQRAA
ncbi:putative myosin-9 [Sesbania bispinosa]|nr:putative myosin-9 [Sesbania bispinosa]